MSILYHLELIKVKSVILMESRMKKICLVLFTMSFIFTSCVGGGGGQRRGSRSFNATGGGATNPDSGTSGEGNGALPDDGGIGNLDGQELPARARLSFLVDPENGSFTRKLSIPQNFQGLMYLRVNNADALIGRNVTVRFRFGLGQVAVDLDNVPVRTAPGILPGLDLQFVTLDFNNREFEDIRLLYDLYDYNNYNEGDTPVTDPLDNMLYCRGLRLEDDNTFAGGGTDTLCDEPGERCLYAFANVEDSALGRISNVNGAMFRPRPTKPQINLGTGVSDYLSPSETQSRENNALKCLPDNGRIRRSSDGSTSFLDYASTLNTTIPLVNTDDPSSVLVSPDSPVHQVNGRNYYFLGPYVPLSTGLWQIQPQAAIWDHVEQGTEPVGLFMRSLSCNGVDCGAVSLKFPRSGVRVNSPANTQYLGSASALGTLTPNQPFDSSTIDRGFNQIVSNGDTLFMDGCNLRVQTITPGTTEGIDSCNVTGSIELVVKNGSNLPEEIIDQTNALKLQLTRASSFNAAGEQVLKSGFNTCNSSSQCKSNECCYNDRCWNSSLVGECEEDAISSGGFVIGEPCSSDFACTSLCCGPQGTCAPHSNNPAAGDALCNKPQGGTCIANSWCEQSPVEDCRIIRTGTDDAGNITCNLVCFNRLEHGECVNNRCQAPISDPRPDFDPNNCAGAEDPPIFGE